MRNIEANADVNVNKVLVGNKCDAEDQRVVSLEEGQQMANRLGIGFMETSAKNSIGVDECFTQLARDVVQRLNDDGLLDQLTQEQDTVDPSQQPPASKSCC